MNRGRVLRRSPSANVVALSMVPVRNPLPSGLKGTSPMPSSRRVGRIVGLGFAPPQGVLALQGGDRLDGVGAAENLDTGFGQAEVGDLAGVDEFLDGSGDILDRHVGIDPMLVEQVDTVGVEPTQGVLDGGADVVGPAVQAGGAVAVEGESELGGDHHVVADVGQSLADELLVGERPVDLGSVEEGDAELDRLADDGDAVLLVEVQAVGMAEAHAAEADGGDLQVADVPLVHDRPFISPVPLRTDPGPGR